MELQHVNVKIYVEGELRIDPEELIEVFHRWVSQQITEELLIDVADYRHVPAGPSVVLLGHEADYIFDEADDRCGLVYNRKAVVEGSNTDRLKQALRAAIGACQQLESEFDRPATLRFSRQEFEVIINDRALAPNSESAYSDCRQEVEAMLQSICGDTGCSFQRHSEDPRCRLGVVVKTSQPIDFTSVA